MNLPRKQVDVVNLRGGIDQASTFVRIPPGAALDLLNYEPELGGGYRRISGYERVDGRPAPSEALYYTLDVDSASSVAVGDEITGASSGATAKVIAKAGDTLGLTRLEGGFEPGETVADTVVVEVEVLDGLQSLSLADEWQLAAESYYRAQIGPVPGDGPILGGEQFKDRKYAFRADGGEVKLYRTSAAGWELVPLLDVLFFVSGGMAAGAFVEGETVITGAASGATATVERFIKNDGSYEADAAGYMVLTMANGAFEDGEDIQVEGVTKAVASGDSAPITLAPGGRFRFDQFNFYGGADTRRLYGCDGVNPAWEFDGEILTPIYYPAPDVDPVWNAPIHIVAYRSHLFLAYRGGQVAHSAIGEPLVFSALMGAAEFGLGDECTGMAVMGGDVLAIYTRGMTYGLYGSNAENWHLQVISESFGARDGTVQKIGTVYALDDKGIAPLQRVQAYGDFENATVSRFVKDILEERKDKVLGSVVVKERNQYRLFFEDGYALVMSDDAYLAESLPAFSTLQYTHIPTCLSNAPDAQGREVILFGTADGFVYQAERGYNFDGQPIEFAYRSPFMNQGAPQARKSYRRIYIDLDTPRRVTLHVATEVSYSDFTVPPGLGQDITVQGGGGYYDVHHWDEMYWDAATYATQGVSLSGTGRNISILIYGNSAMIRPFTIQTLEIHYLPRREKRG